MRFLIVFEGSAYHCRQLAPVAHELIRAGHTVTVASCSDSPNLQIPGWEGPVATIGHLPEGNTRLSRRQLLFYSLSLHRNLTRLVRKDRPDAAVVLDVINGVSAAFWLVSENIPTLLHLADRTLPTAISNRAIASIVGTGLFFGCSFKESVSEMPGQAYFTGFPLPDVMRGSKSASLPLRPTRANPAVLLVLDHAENGSLAPVVAPAVAKIQATGYPLDVHHVVWDAMEKTADHYRAAHASVKVHGFMPEKDYNALLASAHACISRAGASDLFACLSHSLPTIFIPRIVPNYDYQRANAQTLDAAHVALVLDPTALTQDSLEQFLKGIFLQYPSRRMLKKNMEAYFVPNAPVRIREILVRLATEARHKAEAEEKQRAEDLRKAKANVAALHRKPWFRVFGHLWLACAAYSLLRLAQDCARYDGPGVPWLTWACIAIVVLCAIVTVRLLYPRRKP